MSKTGMKYPGLVELKLTSPRQHNDTVVWLQKLINVASPKYVRGLEEDGIFGIQTGEEVEAFCYRMGRPGKAIPAIGIPGLQVLWRWDQGDKLPLEWRARRIARMAVPYSLNKGISAKTWRLLHPGSYPTTAPLSAGLDEARKYIGLKEDSFGNNKVSRLMTLGRSLGAKSTFYNMGYAWCAYFFYLMHLAAGNKTAENGLVNGQFWPLYTPTIDSYARAGSHGHKLESWDTAKPGMGVLFDFDGGRIDHIGMYVRHTATTVTTIDGNTSVGNESNGGQVMERTRSRSLVKTIFSIS